jgi:NMD protein affecting ribosome stability and mRNA decay
MIVDNSHATKLAEEEWERAKGVPCPRCNNETLRLIDGVCPQCAREITEKWEKEREERTLRNHYRAKMREGTIDLRRMREGLL